MKMEDVNARKAYIENVRRSFDSPNRQYEFEQGSKKKPLRRAFSPSGSQNEKGEAFDELSFFKIRLVAAVVLFAVYIFCDRTNTALYHVTTEEVSKQIVKNFDYESARSEVLQAFHIIEP